MEAASERIYDAGNSYICHFISFVIDYMRSYRINIDSMSIRSCVPKDRLLSYLNGGKPNYGDFHEIARAVGINYDSFVKNTGPEATYVFDLPQDSFRWQIIIRGLFTPA